MIRSATHQDIAAMCDIYNEAIAEGGFTGDIRPVSLESRQVWFADHQDPCAIFVWEDIGAVQGYVSVSAYRKGREAFSEVCEVAYYVASGQRGKGLGKRLLSHAIEHATQTGFRCTVAILLGSNARSIGLLSWAGFVESGRIPEAARLGEVRVDHLYLSRKLG